jgi:Carboxypeptidase regulatory-like domain
MTIQNEQLPNIRIASPCHVDWERMTGNDRVRLCDSCERHVYNLVEMSNSEIKALLLETEGRVCGRIFRRFDGTIMTRDCPVGLRALRKRVAGMASAGFATILSCFSVSFAQGKVELAGCQQISNAKIERNKPDPNQLATFKGTVLDLNTAAIANAEISLQAKDSDQKRTRTTNDTGVFSFDNLQDGTYSLTISALGFKTTLVPEIELRANENVRIEISLEPCAVVITGVFSASPEIPEKRSRLGMTIISGDVIRKLPINE